ncbi:MAG TPA: oxidoreductase [Pseudonocardiaceae bacterium]|nr:oxidoreductase [Pseudonocardiaceae bacterium]
MTSKDLNAAAGGTWQFDNDGRPLTRMGYGAMQLAGPGVFGPPADRGNSLAVLRRVVELGINHIDTSDFYGPYVVNELIKEALYPYPENLVLVTKVGARRDEQGGWLAAFEPDELRQGVEDNLTRLGVDTIDLVNLRIHGQEGPEEQPIAKQFEALADLREQGLIRHLGLSNATLSQVAEARAIAPVAQVQNAFNVVDRSDAAMVDHCTAEGIAYVPFFPLGSAFRPMQADVLDAVAARKGVTPQQIALAWLLARSPSILLIPGTSSIEHLEQNVAAANIVLTEDDLAELNTIEN